MARLLGVLILSLMVFGCQKPDKTDDGAKPDPLVASSVVPADTAAAAPLGAGAEPECCDPTKGKPPCDDPAKECGCAKEPGKECPHHAAPANSGAAPCPCKDKGHEGCPHHAAGSNDGTPCPCKDKGEGCPHAGS